MRKVALAVLVLVLGAAKAQPLHDLPFLAQTEAINTVMWFVGFSNDPGEFRPAPLGNVANGLAAGIAPPGLEPAERDLYRQHSAAVIQSLRLLERAGGYDSFQLGDGTTSAVRFFDLNGQTGVLFAGIGSDAHFNTFNSTHASRANRVVFEFLVPEFADLASAWADSGLGWIAVSFTYGASDFTSTLNLVGGELLLAVLPLPSVVSYARFQLTDTELVGRGVFFGGGTGEVRRIDPTRR